MSHNIRPNLLYFESWMKGHAIEALEEDNTINLIRENFSNNFSELTKSLSDAHGYQLLPATEINPEFRLNSSLITKMPNLLAACSTGAGYEVINVDDCTKAGIIVCNQSGANSTAVSEHVFGIMISLSKKINIADRKMREIDRLDRYLVEGQNISTKTIGIIGIGKIGSKVARIANFFEMEVLAYDPYLSRTEINNLGAKKVTLSEISSDADFITLHCPKNSETVNMIDNSFFKNMKKDSYFINTSRGGIVVEDDLFWALNNKIIAGAGIDVWNVEPTPKNDKLLQLENVIATPHCAGMTEQSMIKMGYDAAKQWIEIFQGHRPENLINPNAWEKYEKRFLKIMGFKPSTSSN